MAQCASASEAGNGPFAGVDVDVDNGTRGQGGGGENDVSK